MAVRTAQTKLVGLIESLTEMQSKLVECSSSKQPDAPRLEFEPPNLATISDESSLDLGQIGPTIKKALVANHECLQRFRLDSSHLVFVCSHSIYCNVPTWASRQEHGPGAVAREDACADGWRELDAGARVSRCRCAGSSVERRRRLRVVRVEPHARGAHRALAPAGPRPSARSHAHQSLGHAHARTECLVRTNECRALTRFSFSASNAGTRRSNGI